MGLLQGAIEEAGISTIAISVRPEVTLNMLVPRAVYVRFPTGNPVGEPHKPDQQRTILRGVLKTLEAIDTPGTVVEMPYRWRRMPDEDRSNAIGSTVNGLTRAGVSTYERARTHNAEAEAGYSRFAAAVDVYLAWLRSELDGELQRENPDSGKLALLRPQISYLAELLTLLEGPVHDALVRCSGRVVMFRHWQEGNLI